LTAAWAYALNDGTNGLIKRIENKAVTNGIKSGRFDSIIDKRVEQQLNKKQKEEQQ
jgi:hypothetical protein